METAIYIMSSGVYCAGDGRPRGLSRDQLPASATSTVVHPAPIPPACCDLHPPRYVHSPHPLPRPPNGARPS